MSQEQQELNTAKTNNINDHSSASLIDLVNVIANKVEPIIKIVETIAKNNLTNKQEEAEFKYRMSWVAVAIIVTIVVVSALMTWLNKMDGSTFGFLLGLIIGYALTFIRDTFTPKNE